MFRPRNWLDRVFEIGIIGKGLNGAAELIGGTALLFLTPAHIHHLAVLLTSPALARDPHDALATWVLRSADGLGAHALAFGAVYLLLHGVVKVVLVIALLMNKLWAYPWMIVVLLGFIGYQSYRIAVHASAGLIALTVFDIAIVALTWREYGQQRRHDPRTGSGVGEAAGDGAADGVAAAAVADRAWVAS